MYIPFVCWIYVTNTIFTCETLTSPIYPFLHIMYYVVRGPGIHTYIHSGKPTIALAILVLNPTSIPYKIGSLALVDFQKQSRRFLML